ECVNHMPVANGIVVPLGRWRTGVATRGDEAGSDRAHDLPGLRIAPKQVEGGVRQVLRNLRHAGVDPTQPGAAFRLRPTDESALELKVEVIDFVRFPAGG